MFFIASNHSRIKGIAHDGYIQIMTVIARHYRHRGETTFGYSGL